jgi:branched-chain amino acid transport system ATP-binding protein
MGAMLQVSALKAWYGAAQILFDLALEVHAGEVVTLMGRNGAGKSTTLKAVMGLIERREGVVRLYDADISKLAPYRIARLGIGFAPEDRRIFSDLTVLENLDVGRQPPRQFADGTPAPVFTAARLFALFPPLEERRNHLGNELSGGEQQMLTVARTLMGNPLLVLLDEPSQGVAPLIVEQLADAIVELKKQGVAVLLSEQDIAFAKYVGDRAYAIENGRIKWTGRVDELDNVEL